MDIQIRRATIKDSEALRQLNYEFNGLYVDANKIAYDIENGEEIVVVGVVDDSVVAFACGFVRKSICYNFNDAEISEVYVSENYRRNGIAMKMVKFLEEIFETLNGNHISILTGIKNYPAQQIYKNCGYEDKCKVILVKRLHEKEH
ncbi:GNAT family N-acetyltransferase [Clostridium sp.]|uniref:GNAT family N-acetyltransferase n=1 Tax=Clostridium sp. TaxID=1506 RepID=UPI00321765A9